MGKRGRKSVDDLDVTLGLTDGTIETNTYKRVQVGDKRTETFKSPSETTIIVSEKLLPVQYNGGWQMKSMETIPKAGKTEAQEERIADEAPKYKAAAQASVPKPRTARRWIF